VCVCVCVCVCRARTHLLGGASDFSLRSVLVCKGAGGTALLLVLLTIRGRD
jgi:hypothetical protein